jgi:hypothetical protein
LSMNLRNRTSKSLFAWYVVITCLVVSGSFGATLAAQPERGLRIGKSTDAQDNIVTISDDQGKEVVLYQESHALVIWHEQLYEWLAESAGRAT